MPQSTDFDRIGISCKLHEPNTIKFLLSLRHGRSSFPSLVFAPVPFLVRHGAGVSATGHLALHSPYAQQRQWAKQRSLPVPLHSQYGTGHR